MSELPKERFPKFVEAVLSEVPFNSAMTQVYGDHLKDFEEFQKRFTRFEK